MKSICVFCGSSTGENEIYKAHARTFGKLLAENNISLIFGGGKVGLMGILADSLLKFGGNCIGIIPRSIADLEIAHENCSNLHVVESMQQRKEMMSEMAEAFVALPGGFGTLDELSEVLTYNQLRFSRSYNISFARLARALRSPFSSVTCANKEFPFILSMR